MSNPVNVDFITKVVEIEVDDTQKESLAAMAAVNAAKTAKEKATEANNSAITAEALVNTLTDVYNEAIEQGTVIAPVVDKTMLMTGAAADAKVTGDVLDNIVGTVRNYSPVYSKWDAYGALTSTIHDDDAAFTMAGGGTSFSFSRFFNVDGDTFKIGDTLYAACYNVATATANMPFQLRFYNGNTEISDSRVSKSIANGTSFAAISGVIPATATHFRIMYAGTSPTAFSVGKTVLSKQYLLEKTTSSRTDYTGVSAVDDELKKYAEILAKVQDTVLGIPVDYQTNSQNGYYSVSNGSYVWNSASNSTSCKIDLSEYIGKSVFVDIYESTATVSTRITGMGNNAGTAQPNGYYNEHNLIGKKTVFGISEDYPYLYLSFAHTLTTGIDVRISPTIEDEIKKYYSTPVYVSPNGDDANNGSINAPMLTINEALKKSSNVFLLGGTYDGETIKTDDFDYSSISICGTPNVPVIVKFPTTTIADDGSETLVTGYTKVHQISCPTFPFAEGTTKGRLYQDGVADTFTEIPVADRHPLQRGLQYRCDSTILYQMESIADIESATTKYGWYWDNGVMYFSRPQASSASHPIVAPIRDKTLVKMPTTPTSNVTVTMRNIEVHYGDVRLGYSSGHRLDNVRVKYPYVSNGGCFYLYCVTDTILNRCEACSVTQGGNIGDGFNVDTPTTTGSENATCLSVLLKDCWSHDNNDDGYSDHDRSEVTVDGGLYEYNGKGGLTPAYGSNDVIRNVISRYNRGSGILATGNPTAENGRLCTSVNAENCVCYGQEYGFRSQESQCIITAVNCITYNNRVGYRADDGQIYAVNCKTNDTTAKSGNVTIQSVNELT